MKDNDNSGLIWGLIIGAIIAIAILSRNNQNVLSPSVHIQQRQQLIWKPIDIPRVDDVMPQTTQQQIDQSSLIQIQQDPQLIKALSELQKTSFQLEQATSKLQELQEIVLKLKQDSTLNLQQVH